MPDLSIDLSNRDLTHTIRILHDLSKTGWTPTQFPDQAALLPNRQLIQMRALERTIQLRVSIYKVGDRGEPHRLDERRIEITTTFASGLPRLHSWADVVLGYDFNNDAFVGLDPRRLSLGGATHNASSSVDPAALLAASHSSILIRPHETPSLGLEYQAIFKSQRLSEYFFNYEAIHRGAYDRTGMFSGTMRHSAPGAWSLPLNACHGRALILSHSTAATIKSRIISVPQVQAFEIDQIESLANLSPDELEAIRRKCKEVGDRGEHFVYRNERRRLHRAGRADLADRIEWVSQVAVGRGYDIKSFEVDGSPRNIEVKATIANGKTFFMSNNEWNIATRMGTRYWIYRVATAFEDPRIVTRLQDPVGTEATNIRTRVADGWRVTLH